MKKIRTAIIGCGSIANFRHAPEYAANSNCEFIGSYDFNTDRAQLISTKYGGKVYSTIDELLSDPNVDAVSVCTSNDKHAEITIKALKNGKHVLCEKPMATSIEDCIEMAEVANEVGKTLMIGHNQRFAPAHVLAKKLLHNGDLGNVLTFQTTFGHKGPEYWGIDKNVSTWFFKKDAAIMGATADLGIHKLDLIMWLLNDKVEETSAFCETLDKKDAGGNLIGIDDNMVCILKMKKGSIGTLSASWTHYGEENNSTILYCKNGIMKIYDNPLFPIEIVMMDGTKSFHELGAIQTNDDLVQTNSGVINAFIDAISENHEPAVSANESLEAMKAIFACIKSAQEGKHIKV